MKWFGKKREPEAIPAREAPASRSGPFVRRSDWRSFNDDVAAAYGRAVAPQMASIAADVVAAAEVQPGGRLLDVGTGTGAVVAVAFAGGVAAAGVDPSFAMLRTGRAKDPSLRLAAAETINLPFRNDMFHAATAAFVLSMFTKLDTALFDIVRVLRPGGRLATASWEAGEDELQKTWRDLTERAVGVELMRDGLREAEPWSAVAGDRARLEEALRDAGLHPVRVERLKYKLQISREDYIAEKTTEASGRFVRGMLGDEWDGFLQDARAAYAAAFPEMLVDFRDVLLAVGTKP